MKNLIASSMLALAVVVSGRGSAQADSFSTGNLQATIPDNDLNGYQNSFSLSGLGGTVQHVSITLNLSGGFNGDLYAYLYHDRTSAILLNRVGRSSASAFGYPNAGFGPDAAANSFTFDDLASHDVHFYGAFAFNLNPNGQLTGQWQPDGRALNPQAPGSAFDTAPRSNPLSVFNGRDPNGVWSLYIVDVSPGGQSTLLNWGLTVDVPEPSSAVLLWAGLAGGAAWLRCRSRAIRHGFPRL